MKKVLISGIGIVFGLIATGLFEQEKPKNIFEDLSVEPQYVTPVINGNAPSDAIVLFDGRNLSEWENIKRKDGTAGWIVENGCFTIEPGAGNIFTKKAFGNCQLHIEFRVPENEQLKNHHWGNSGIFLMGLYEVQIYSSNLKDHPIYYNGQAGSVYKQRKPLVNASLPNGEWQSFDIIFTAPWFDNNQVLQSPALLTVFQNGVLVQWQVPLLGPTTAKDFTEYKFHPEQLPLVLEEQGSRVSFRNVWIRELNLGN